MTELLNPAQTNITRSASSHTSEVFGSVTPRTNDAPTSLPSHPTDSHGAQRGTTVHSQGVDLAVESLSVEDIRGLSTRHLRILVNRAYQLLDTDYPATGVIEGYELIVGELDVRAQQATNRGYVPQLRETFRDNPLYGRFELLIDGTLAVYVRYTMKAGRVVLTDGVEHPGVRDQGMDMTLMRHIVLNAHKRRLSLIPQCPMAFSFLADHPQYQALTARPTH